MPELGLGVWRQSSFIDYPDSQPKEKRGKRAHVLLVFMVMKGAMLVIDAAYILKGEPVAGYREMRTWRWEDLRLSS